MKNQDASLYPELAPSAPPPGLDNNAPPYPMGQPPAYTPTVATMPQAEAQQAYYNQPTAQQQAPAPVVITTSQSFGPYPIKVLCPVCNKDAMTKTEPVAGSLAYLLGMALCFCCCCLFWVPCCLNRTRDVRHKCRNCGNFLGQYKRL